MGRAGSGALALARTGATRGRRKCDDLCFAAEYDDPAAAELLRLEHAVIRGLQQRIERAPDRAGIGDSRRERVVTQGAGREIEDSVPPELQQGIDLAGGRARIR